MALFAGLSGQAQVAVPVDVTAEPAVTPGSGPPAATIPRNWLSQVMSNIAASEYEIRWQPGVGAYQAPNRAQNLRFTFLDDGFEVHPRTNAGPELDWQAALQVDAYGRARGFRAPGSPSWTIDGRTATATSPGLTIEYSNDKRGMRQTFVLPDRPSGGGAVLLLLRVELQGLAMTVHPEEGFVSFAPPSDAETPALFYSDLRVWDHGGQSLAATFQPLDDNSFAIVVDDSSAQYPIVVDPLTYSVTKEGNDAYAYYGMSVASAGDVNGDGYSEVIVGASCFDSGQTDEGKVFVYYGSSSGLSTTADWTAESDQAYSNMGRSVACAGDVNGDGYSDVIVGAERYIYETYNQGAAFVWFGSSGGLGANGTPGNSDWRYYGSTQTSNGFGRAVACAGDVNGDGFSDIIISAPYYSSYYRTHDGAVSAFYGSSGGPGGPSRTYYGGQDYAEFGSSVASAGDVNGDGYSDIIIGAPSYDGGNTDEGRVFVYHGSSSGLSGSANWTADSNKDGAHLGWSASSAGDVNGDGYSDIVVGAPTYSQDYTGEGAAFVWHGGSGGLGDSGTPLNADWESYGGQASANFGQSVASAGDVNGDGYADIIVGAPRYDNGQSDEGRAYVWLGSVLGLGDDGTPDNANWIGEMDYANAQFGTSVACAGDVDGNGYSDIIVGAPYYDNGQTDEGAAFVFQGYPDGLALVNAWSADSNQPGADFGWSVASAGDVNGDGFSDVIIGAYKFDSGQTDEGRAFVFHGGASGLSPHPTSLCFDS